jgi:16S rRNA (cytosine967-C5)-methyltransferase
MSLSAREAAFKALGRYRRDAAFSDAALNSILLKEDVDPRDTALGARIFYGVLQNTAFLDYTIAVFSTVKPAKMEPQVLDILRLSVYQIVFMSKIPVTAAVNEGVELVKKHANQRAAGLVNAILRKIAINRDSLPPVTGGDPIDVLSVRYSHPAHLVRMFADRLGLDGAEALLRSNNEDVPATVMINTLRSDTESVLCSLRGEHCQAEAHPWLKSCAVLRSPGNIERYTAYRDGLIWVQDTAAALAVSAAGPQAGMTVIDGCAAPGGKSYASAVFMNNTGTVLACDISAKKLGRLSEGARRLGFTAITTRVSDARAPDPTLHHSADIVIADVPCSGFGVIRKKPEIRYKREEDIFALPRLQMEIAESLSSYVKPGGILLYSTCTLLERENEEVVEAFLKSHSDFTPEPFLLPAEAGGAATGGMMTLWPHLTGTDGFFIARLRRRL